MKSPQTSFHRIALAATAALALLGCATWEPLPGIPITVEDRAYYELTQSHASYKDGVLLVRGDFTLKRGVEPPKTAHFDVRVFNAAGAVVATAAAKFERDPHEQGTNDPRLDAAFHVRIPVPREQVARIELDYDAAAHPAAPPAAPAP